MVSSFETVRPEKERGEIMKKAIFAILILGLVVIGSMGAYAWQGSDNMVEKGTYHEQMEEILETGNFEDLKTLREETGMPIMRRVIDQASFEEMQTRHTEMVAQYGEGPHFGAHGPRDGSMRTAGEGQRMHINGQGMRGQGNGQNIGNCPYEE